MDRSFSKGSMYIDDSYPDNSQKQATCKNKNEFGYFKTAKNKLPFKWINLSDRFHDPRSVTQNMVTYE